MPKKNTAKSSSQRKLNFDDSIGLSNAVKRDEGVQPRSQKRAGAPKFLPSAKRRDHESTDSYMSPQKKVVTEATAASVVTPDNFETTTKIKMLQTKSDDYIPSYIHKNVEYVRKGQIMKLSPTQSKVLRWIGDHCEIPKDFEQNRKYGPLSGSSYADRVITAYRLGLLKKCIADSDHDDKTRHIHPSMICTVCADLEHVADACPTLM